MKISISRLQISNFNVLRNIDIRFESGAYPRDLRIGHLADFKAGSIYNLTTIVSP